MVGHQILILTVLVRVQVRQPASAPLRLRQDFGGSELRLAEPNSLIIMYYTYILKSLKTGRLYKGWTHSLEARLKSHESMPGILIKPMGHLNWFGIVHLRINIKRLTLRSI